MEQVSGEWKLRTSKQERTREKERGIGRKEESKSKFDKKLDRGAIKLKVEGMFIENLERGRQKNKILKQNLNLLA